MEKVEFARALKKPQKMENHSARKEVGPPR